MPKYKAVTLELPKEDEPFELPEGIIPLQVWPGANGMVLICLLPFNEEQADVEEKNTTSIEEEGPPITNRESTNGDFR
jgi:hypothetical protein